MNGYVNGSVSVSVFVMAILLRFVFKISKDFLISHYIEAVTFDII